MNLENNPKNSDLTPNMKEEITAIAEEAVSEGKTGLSSDMREELTDIAKETLSTKVKPTTLDNFRDLKSAIDQKGISLPNENKSFKTQQPIEKKEKKPSLYLTKEQKNIKYKKFANEITEIISGKPFTELQKEELHAQKMEKIKEKQLKRKQEQESLKLGKALTRKNQGEMNVVYDGRKTGSNIRWDGKNAYDKTRNSIPYNDYVKQLPKNEKINISKVPEPKADPNVIELEEVAIDNSQPSAVIYFDGAKESDFVQTKQKIEDSEEIKKWKQERGIGATKYSDAGGNPLTKEEFDQAVHKTKEEKKEKEETTQIVFQPKDDKKEEATEVSLKPDVDVLELTYRRAKKDVESMKKNTMFLTPSMIDTAKRSERYAKKAYFEATGKTIEAPLSKNKDTYRKRIELFKNRDLRKMPSWRRWKTAAVLAGFIFLTTDSDTKKSFNDFENIKDTTEIFVSPEEGETVVEKDIATPFKEKIIEQDIHTEIVKKEVAVSVEKPQEKKVLIVDSKKTTDYSATIPTKASSSDFSSIPDQKMGIEKKSQKFVPIVDDMRIVDGNQHMESKVHIQDSPKKVFRIIHDGVHTPRIEFKENFQFKGEIQERFSQRELKLLEKGEFQTVVRITQIPDERINNVRIIKIGRNQYALEMRGAAGSKAVSEMGTKERAENIMKLFNMNTVVQKIVSERMPTEYVSSAFIPLSLDQVKFLSHTYNDIGTSFNLSSI